MGAKGPACHQGVDTAAVGDGYESKIHVTTTAVCSRHACKQTTTAPLCPADCGTSATTQIESCRSLRTPSAASTYAAAAAATAPAAAASAATIQAARGRCREAGRSQPEHAHPGRSRRMDHRKAGCLHPGPFSALGLRHQCVGLAVKGVWQGMELHPLAGNHTQRRPGQETHLHAARTVPRNAAMGGSPPPISHLFVSGQKKMAYSHMAGHNELYFSLVQRTRRLTFQPSG
mmetsp:Transcript_82177/g.133347  ORF Transcript_82177/g.133347 Transcript_82177/m.133347 type:complete len:231 (+) Transcript_82177:624-1316(+)